MNATVLSFAANPALVGLRIPEVPRNVFTFQTLYSNPSARSPWARATFGIQGRFVGRQYDDDLNQLPLGKFFVLGALVSYPLGHGLKFLPLPKIFSMKVTRWRPLRLWNLALHGFSERASG